MTILDCTSMLQLLFLYATVCVQSPLVWFAFLIYPYVLRGTLKYRSRIVLRARGGRYSCKRCTEANQTREMEERTTIAFITWDATVFGEDGRPRVYGVSVCPDQESRYI